MYRFHQLACAGLCFAILPTVAPAQDLAEEILQEYANDMIAQGYSVDVGNKDTSGNSVTWQDITMSLNGEFSGRNQTRIPWVRATEIGGDAVEVVFADTISGTSSATSPEPIDMQLSAVIGENRSVVTGSAENRSWNSTVSSFQMTLVGSGDGIGAMDMNFFAEGLQGVYVRSSSGEDVNWSGGYTAARAGYDYDIADGENDVDMEASYDNIQITFDVDLLSEDELEKLLTGDKSFRLALSADGSRSAIAAVTPDAPPMAFTSQSSAMSLGLQMLSGQALLNGSAQDIVINADLSGMGLPPADVKIANQALSLSMPLKKTDQARPADIRINMTGLELPEFAWMMVDPGQTLPRDPANLNIDLGASVRWLVDLMELDTADIDMPAQADSVEIRDITLELAGASLKGIGGATINNDGPIPMPVGSVTLDLRGGLTLLDKLVALGMVPEGQSQMFRAMSGMFAKPGTDGGDHLTSVIEMKENGSILANGVPLQ